MSHAHSHATYSPEVIVANNTCFLGIEVSIELWPLSILGDPFLRKYYTIFDRDSAIQRPDNPTPTLFPRVGFAIANPPSSSSGPRVVSKRAQ